jgi:hypothetical protein
MNDFLDIILESSWVQLNEEEDMIQRNALNNEISLKMRFHDLRIEKDASTVSTISLKMR